MGRRNDAQSSSTGAVVLPLVTKPRDRRRIQRAPLPGVGTPGFLQQQSVTSRTRTLYLQYVADAEEDLHTKFQPNMPVAKVDALLEKHVNKMFGDGASIAQARYAVYAVAWRCRIATRCPTILPLAKQSLKGFMRLDPETSKDPGPWEAALLVAAHSILTDPLRGPDAAASILCQFDLFCRPGEINALAKQHVLPPKGKYKLWSVIICPSTESRTTKTHQQDDTLIVGASNSDRLWLVDVWRALHRRAVADTSPLIRLAPREIAGAINRASRDLQLKALRLTPHSWRHGGASVDALAGVELSVLQRRGRWQCLSSVRRYENMANFSDRSTRSPMITLRWPKWLVGGFAALFLALFSASRCRRLHICFNTFQHDGHSDLPTQSHPDYSFENWDHFFVEVWEGLRVSTAESLQSLFGALLLKCRSSEP